MPPLFKKALQTCSVPIYRLLPNCRSAPRFSLSPVSSTNFSTTATTYQGNSYESFFRHDSGRWLYNENIRLAESYQEFDVRALKRVAARAINRNESEAATVVKTHEDHLGRTFAVTSVDGTRVIARIPHPLTAHKRYATASEVATMDFVRKHAVPTPRVLAYDTTADNEVGTQYILMEAAQGQNVGQQWESMDKVARQDVVVPIVGMETKLMALGLPASGSIYYKRDLEPGTKTVEIPSDLGEKFGTATGDGFCIGPSAHNDWWHHERGGMNEISRGPFNLSNGLRTWLTRSHGAEGRSSEEYLRSVVEREVAWMKQYARPRYPNPVYHRRFFRYERVCPEDHVKNLEDFLRLIEHLTPRQMSVVNNTPILLQENMQLRNLFVNAFKPDEESDVTVDIVSMTNWGQASVLPLFLQAGIPPPLSGMDEDYIEITRMLNLAHRMALQDAYTPAGRLASELCKVAAQPWKGDSVTMKAFLVRAVRDWAQLTGVTGATVQAAEIVKSGVEKGELPKTALKAVEELLNPEIPACPLSYSAPEMERGDAVADKLLRTDGLFETLRKGLQLDRTGFVTHELYKDAKAMSEWSKERLIAIAEDKHVEKYEYGVMWPFDDHDETGQSCPIYFDDAGEMHVVPGGEGLDEEDEG